MKRSNQHNFIFRNIVKIILERPREKYLEIRGASEDEAHQRSSPRDRPVSHSLSQCEPFWGKRGRWCLEKLQISSISALNYELTNHTQFIVSTIFMGIFRSAQLSFDLLDGRGWWSRVGSLDREFGFCCEKGSFCGIRNSIGVLLTFNLDASENGF